MRLKDETREESSVLVALTSDDFGPPWNIGRITGLLTNALALVRGVQISFDLIDHCLCHNSTMEHKNGHQDKSPSGFR